LSVQSLTSVGDFDGLLIANRHFCDLHVNLTFCYLSLLLPMCTFGPFGTFATVSGRWTARHLPSRMLSQLFSRPRVGDYDWLVVVDSWPSCCISRVIVDRNGCPLQNKSRRVLYCLDLTLIVLVPQDVLDVGFLDWTLVDGARLPYMGDAAT